MLSEIRIPLWLTEVDVLEKDPVKRADNLETVMRSAFSTPSVQGLILWSFWNYSSWRGPYTSLVDGNDWEVRENIKMSSNRYCFVGEFTEAKMSKRFTSILFEPYVKSSKSSVACIIRLRWTLAYTDMV